MKIPSSISDYYFATCTSPDVTVDNKIMPLRSNTDPTGSDINVRKCLRGVDVMFLAEAIATRTAIAYTGEVTSSMLTMDGKIKSSRLTDIDTGIGNLWSTWADRTMISTGFSGINYPSSFPPETGELVSLLKTNTGFSNAIGTRVASGATFNNLIMNDVLNLFKDIKKKQCCIMTLGRAEIDGRTSNNGLFHYSQLSINKYGINDITGPTYASSLTVSYTFPQCAEGSKVMLFMAGAYDWMKADDYPSSQDGGYASCFIPTDGIWHTIPSGGSFSVNISPITMVSNIMSTCNARALYEEAPQDPDPESTKSRQSVWNYYLANSNDVIGIVDLEHTNLVDTAI